MIADREPLGRDPQVKPSELVTIGWAHGTFDAYLAMSMLMSAGIPVHAQPLHTLNANWTLSQAFGGIAIQVPGTGAAEAWEILSGFNGNSDRRWRRWSYLVFAVLVLFLANLPPPANGYTPSTRWRPQPTSTRLPS
jgi:hypothetical protein